MTAETPFAGGSIPLFAGLASSAQLAVHCNDALPSNVVAENCDVRRGLNADANAISGRFENFDNDIVPDENRFSGFARKAKHGNGLTFNVCGIQSAPVPIYAAQRGN